MSVLSVLEAVAIPFGILAVIYLAYLHDRRKQRRAAELRWLYAKQRAARYFELEFLVAPPPFDWSCDVEWEDAA